MVFSGTDLYIVQIEGRTSDLHGLCLKENLAGFSIQYSILVVKGLRKSGKTTLAKTAFPGLAYISLEDLNVREFVKTILAFSLQIFLRSDFG